MAKVEGKKLSAKGVLMGLGSLTLGAEGLMGSCWEVGTACKRGKDMPLKPMVPESSTVQKSEQAASWNR